MIANPPQVVLHDSGNLYDEFQVSYYRDATNAATIEEMINTSFKEESSNKFSFGYIKDTLWFKIKLKNESSKDDFILSLNEHFYETANLYYYDTSWKKLQNEVFTPLTQRSVQTSKLSFEFKIPQDTSQTLYIELNGKFPYFGDLVVYKKEYFFSHQIISMESFFIFVFGVLLIIILFNLFLWLKLGDKIYIYYVGYTFFALLYLINISGLLAYLDLQYYMYKLHFTVGFAIVFLNLFSIEYFNAKRHLKYATYLLKFLAFCVLLFGIISVFIYTPWNKLITYTVSLSIVSLIVTALIIYKRGQHYLKYYIFAILLYFISIITFTLLLSGALNYSFFARYFFLFALVVEIVVFSLMLADRYNDIKNKQIQTQKQLISLQNNQNKILEEEVTKQTQSLQDANGKLSSLVQERELLVKEVFHRVKNNFHMISAFLWFESKKEVNPNRFSELINRIKSMSLIHEYVCNSKNLLHINAEEYLVELINTIMRTYHNMHVTVNTKIEAMHIDFDHIMSMGIILNEIISNSVKHHPATSSITLEITCLKKSDNIVLRIKDNGRGFDAKSQQTGFGLELIKDFSKKLPQGQFNFYQDAGTVFELSFKDIKNDKI